MGKYNRAGYLFSALMLWLICWTVQGSTKETLDDRLQPADHIEGKFRQQRFIQVLSVPLVSSGTFTFDRDEGVTWRTMEPVENLIKIDPHRGVLAGETASELKQVTSSRAVAEIFLSLFSGDIGRLKEMFSVEEKLVGEDWLLTLVPSSPELAKQVSSITVRGDRYVEAICLEEGNGDRSEITLDVTVAD